MVNIHRKTRLSILSFLLLASACTKQSLTDTSGQDRPVVASTTITANDSASLEHVGSSNLSVARIAMGTTVNGPRIYFAGGTNPVPVFNADSTAATIAGGPVDVVDIYDTQLNVWYVKHFSRPRTAVAATTVGRKSIFAGGLTPDTAKKAKATRLVEIFDEQTASWTTASLSVARSEIAAASVGSKAYFAGGLDSLSNATDIIDVYDAATNTWSTMRLPSRKRSAAAIVKGKEILFVGGGADLGIPAPMTPSPSIDIYNTETGAWTSSQLALVLFPTRAAAAGNRFFFGCGTPMPFFSTNLDRAKEVNVFEDISKWVYTIAFKERRDHGNIAGVGNKVIVAGGYGTSAKSAEIYDTRSGQMTTTSLVGGGSDMDVAVVGNRVYFAGGRISANKTITYSNVVDIFELKNSIP